MDSITRSIGASHAQRAPGRPILGKRSLAVLGGAALLIAASWYGWSWWSVGRFLQSTDDAYVGGDITPIAPKVAGFIVQVAVGDNQSVKAGDLLVKLDDRDYRALLAQTEASIAAQEAALANLDATYRLQLAMIDQAVAEITATAAEVARAKDDAERYHALSNTQAASLQRFQQADADYKKALAADQKARAGRDAATRQLDVIDTRKRQIQAALDQASAERDIARLNLSYTEIRSPIDGVIGNRNARVGAYATVGAALLAVVPTQGLWVDANFKESQIGRLRQGQSVAITADVFPGEVFSGRVQSLAPATGAQFSVIPAENATGNFTKIVQRVPVRIVLDGDAAELGLLRPGLSVSAVIDERTDTATRVAGR
jgi:membrane fusion protein (multidrug efflux system)